MAAGSATRDSLRIIDGSFDWVRGADSSKVTTIAGPQNENGVRRDQLAWMVNGTCRGGGIYPRAGYQPRLQTVPWSGLFQGAYLYEPAGDNPYHIVQIGGRIYKVRSDTDYSVTDLSAAFGLTNPASVEQVFFCQGEIFLIIQAGDYLTLPLIWDGSTLRRSNGIVPPTVTPGVFTIKNVSDAANVGATIAAQASASITTGGVTIAQWTNLASWTLPAVGASVNVPVNSFLGTVPQTINFTLANGLSQTKPCTITAYTAPTTTSAGFYELPAAGPMDYYMGRLWYAFGRSWTAGDIVRGPSGTEGFPYYKLDSILKVTENSVAANGDGFQLPSNAGNIRAIAHTAELNTQTGEGRLYIFTRKSIYRMDVPVTRDDWTASGDGTVGTVNPFVTVAQINYGSVSDRCIVQASGDLFYQTLEPAVRSLALAIRNFGSWGNTAISTEERRAIELNDRELMHAATGILFNNRLYQSVLPFETPVGIAHKGVMSLDFDLITTMAEKLPPAWEGMLEGVSMLQMNEGDFGGLQRAFAWVVSAVNGNIELWEITLGDKRDNGDNRIQMMIETPSYTWGNAFALKRLESLEIWYDRLFGALEVEVFFRPDQHPCWIPWHAFKDCSARDCTEDIESSAGCSGTYPNQAYCEQFRATQMLPSPPSTCLQQSGRPANQAYQYQIKILSKGSWRIRGLLLHAVPLVKAPYQGLVC